MTQGPGTSDQDTASRILEVAQRLVQTRGFNGFSYADVAAELGVTKAGLHYHFASKAELGEALVERYSSRFFDHLAEVEAAGAGAVEKLQAYADLYAEVLRDRRMCLCGMLAAEYQTLPESMRSKVLAFLERNERWLTTVLEEGRADGSFTFDGSARETAQMIVAALEGAMLVSRPYGDDDRFGATARHLLAGLVST
jgi:TetR/AcrR family transcriptional repressor of nem operon